MCSRSSKILSPALSARQAQDEHVHVHVHGHEHNVNRALAIEIYNNKNDYYAVNMKVLKVKDYLCFELRFVFFQHFYE